ncbi:ATP-binding cassette sub-family G member 5 isoform X2 [Rhodnius prolixus]|uniref:ATP-binding cassette sub-family G member 5 isoform X2 n=1 Tax=Rhodnius prolixus TaxID=13249 RepID=UPI003D18CC37
MPENWEMEQRRFSIAGGDERLPPPSRGMVPSTSEDLHAWSIYRQNLNSDFTDSALGSSEKSPLPYGNFQLRESTVQSILNHPRYGPKSPLGANMYAYLKFGLPRVFPPNQGRGTSSGYNSSEEGGVQKKNLRSRSEADFTNLHYHHPVSTLGASGGKSLSQADLLSTETLIRQAAASQRRSLHDLRHTDYLHDMMLPGRGAGDPMLPHHHLMPPHHHHPAGPVRHRVSQQSQRLRRTSAGVAPASGITSPEPFSFSMLHPQQYTGLYPHLQVRNMNIRNKKGEPVVNNLSMEVKAGEILSIMATNSCTGTSLLEALSGRLPYTGQVSINGLSVSPKDLRSRTAVVHKDAVLPRDLQVHSCMRYYARLRRAPGSRGKLPMDDQVSIVTEELGLSPVLATRISELTQSEYCRLLVALQLLSDPQILLIDDVTQPMDIFDTFFLVEFLRYWGVGATGGVAGRIVVMCLQPPTYEILTMVSRLLMLSGGDTMYHGPSMSLQHYFMPAHYPCPAYKNPADYYLDLVTLDDLSAEAMLESSQRVDQLGSLYRRRQALLSETSSYTLPNPFKTPPFYKVAFTLLLRDTIYSLPVSFTRWIARVVISAVTSIIVGAIFWDIPSSDPHLTREDRMGYHYTMLSVMSWPMILLLGLSKTHGHVRSTTESDIRQGLYSRLLYIVTSLIFSVIPSALTWLAYLIPAYCMSGLYEQGSLENLFIYLGESVVTLLSLQYICTFFGYCSPGRSVAALLYTAFHTIISAFSGFPVYTADIPVSLLVQYTPLAPVYSSLLYKDYSHDVLKNMNSALICRNRHVQRQDIIVSQPCPVPNGTYALEYHGITSSLYGISVPAIWLASALLLTIFVFLLSPLFQSHKKRKR